MTRKKLQVMLAAITLSVTLAACGGGNGDPSIDVNGDRAANVSTPGNATGSETETNGEVREIVIRGYNFDFDQEEYNVSVGETVKLVYHNAEGNHGIFIEGIKIRLRNKEDTTVTFSEPGTYEIICNVYCGAGHAGMKAKLIVQ